MATPAHISGNKKYLQKYMTKSVRVKKTEWQAVQAHYKALGHSSFAGYVGALIRADMTGDLRHARDTGIQIQQVEGQTDLFGADVDKDTKN